MKVKLIKSVKIDIGGEIKELSYEDAKLLKEELDKIFPPKEFAPRPHWPEDIAPPRRMDNDPYRYPWTTPYIPGPWTLPPIICSNQP